MRQYFVAKGAGEGRFKKVRPRNMLQNSNSPMRFNKTGKAWAETFWPFVYSNLLLPMKSRCTAFLARVTTWLPVQW